MLFNDFDVFYHAAQILMRGGDPYALYGVYYPLPTLFLFIPLAVLPLPVAQALWTIFEIIIVLGVLRSRAVSTILFMPMLLSFVMGQLVIPMLGVFCLLRSAPKWGGIALALLLIKPQLVVFVAPWMIWQWWRNDRRQIVWFVTLVAVGLLAAFLIQPGWVSSWLAVSGERMRAPISPSIWGLLSFLPQPMWLILCALVTGVVFLWAWRKNDLDIMMAASMLVNPVLISYDQVLLIPPIRSHRFWILMTLFSWGLFALSAWLLSERWGVLIPLVVTIYLVRYKSTSLQLALAK